VLEISNAQKQQIIQPLNQQAQVVTRLSKIQPAKTRPQSLQD
jgi:hypothetical protein